MLWPFTLWISYYKALRIVYLARPINFSCEQWQTLVIAKGWTLAKLLHPLPTPSLILSLPHSPSLSSLILSPLPSLPPLSLTPLPLTLHVFKSMYVVIWKWYHTMGMESYHTMELVSYHGHGIIPYHGNGWLHNKNGDNFCLCVLECPAESSWLEFMNFPSQ